MSTETYVHWEVQYADSKDGFWDTVSVENFPVHFTSEERAVTARDKYILRKQYGNVFRIVKVETTRDIIG